MERMAGSGRLRVTAEGGGLNRYEFRCGGWMAVFRSVHKTKEMYLL